MLSSVNVPHIIVIAEPNGAGKSTLLRLITGAETPEDGTVHMGTHNVIPSYFEQNQAEALDLNKTVLQTIHDEVPDWKNEEVRTQLIQTDAAVLRQKAHHIANTRLCFCRDNVDFESVARA